MVEKSEFFAGTRFDNIGEISSLLTYSRKSGLIFLFDGNAIKYSHFKNLNDPTKTKVFMWRWDDTPTSLLLSENGNFLYTWNRATLRIFDVESKYSIDKRGEENDILKIRKIQEYSYTVDIIDVKLDPRSRNHFYVLKYPGELEMHSVRNRNTAPKVVEIPQENMNSVVAFDYLQGDFWNSFAIILLCNDFRIFLACPFLPENEFYPKALISDLEMKIRSEIEKNNLKYGWEELQWLSESFDNTDSDLDTGLPAMYVSNEPITFKDRRLKPVRLEHCYEPDELKRKGSSSSSRRADGLSGDLFSPTDIKMLNGDGDVIAIATDNARVIVFISVIDSYPCWYGQDEEKTSSTKFNVMRRSLIPYAVVDLGCSEGLGRFLTTPLMISHSGFVVLNSDGLFHIKLPIQWDIQGRYDASTEPDISIVQLLDTAQGERTVRANLIFSNPEERMNESILLISEDSEVVCLKISNYNPSGEARESLTGVFHFESVATAEPNSSGFRSLYGKYVKEIEQNESRASDLVELRGASDTLRRYGKITSMILSLYSGKLRLVEMSFLAIQKRHEHLVRKILENNRSIKNESGRIALQLKNYIALSSRIEKILQRQEILNEKSSSIKLSKIEETISSEERTRTIDKCNNLLYAFKSKLEDIERESSLISYRMMSISENTPSRGSFGEEGAEKSLQDVQEKIKYHDKKIEGLEERLLDLIENFDQLDLASDRGGGSEQKWYY